MSQCLSCHAGCCRSFAIPVSGADILRINSTRGLTFWDFVCRWADHSGSIALRHAPHFFFPDEPKTPFVICLTHSLSKTFPGTTKCRFLDEGAATEEYPYGISRCGIYLDRPAACRSFPTRLGNDGHTAVVYPVPPRGRPGSNPAFNLCKDQWTPDDFDPVHQVQELIVAEYEMRFFHLLADSWNEAPGQWEVFPEFIRLVYSARIGSGAVSSTAAAEADDPAVVAPDIFSLPERLNNSAANSNPASPADATAAPAETIPFRRAA